MGAQEEEGGVVNRGLREQGRLIIVVGKDFLQEIFPAGVQAGNLDDFDGT